jgi:hypothetical protein
MKPRTILMLLLPAAALWLVCYIGSLLPPFCDHETKDLRWFVFPYILTSATIVICAAAPIVQHMDKVSDPQ